jgi:hypothetical protein
MISIRCIYWRLDYHCDKLGPFGRKFQASNDGLKSVDVTSKYIHNQLQVNNDQIIEK